MENKVKEEDVLIFDEIHDYIGEVEPTIDEGITDYSMYKEFIELKGYDPEEFLNDELIESPADIIAKLNAFDQNKSLEDYFEDEEIREAILLKKQGKINSAKEWLNYVKVDEAPVEFDDDSAKAYLKNHFKSIGMKDSLIERNINLLETNDELVEEAQALAEEYNKTLKEKEESRKQDYLNKQAEETKRLQLQFQEDLLQMKSYISEQPWDRELKDYTNKEVINVLEDLNTGKVEKSQTLKSLFTALTDKTQAPKLIAYISKIIVEGKVNIEEIKKVEKTKIIDDKVLKWKSAGNQKVSGVSKMHRTEVDDNQYF